MKTLKYHCLGYAVISVLFTWSVCAENSAPGFIDFGKFSPPAGGGEFVEVHINSNLLAMAARLTEKKEPEVGQLLRGLRSIRVNVIGLNAENRAEMENRMQAIRHDLDTRQWERIVNVQQPNQNVGVYLKTRGEEAVEGLAVTVLEARQAVFVNIVGDIKPEKVALLGERFNIEPLKKVGQTLENK